MKNYSELSDFEINKLVAIHRGHQCYYGDGSYTNDGLNVTVKGNGRIGWFNPCRLPEDAWPIIVENGISIHHEICKWSVRSLVYNKKYEDGFFIFRSSSEVGDVSSRAALRAAMIVYLMIKDNENA